MTLPASGTIKLSNVRTELSGGTGSINLGGSGARGLAGIASGTIALSSLYGKTAVGPMSPWTQSNQFTGKSRIAISGDGLVLAMLSGGSLEVRTWDSGTSTWILQTADYTTLGESLAISYDGSTIVVGAPTAASTYVGAGLAHVFTRSGNSWSLRVSLSRSYTGLGTPQSNDNFGRAVALNSSGTKLVVGIPNYDWNTNSNTGAVVTFTGSGASWTHQSTSYPSFDSTPVSNSYGFSVALSADGNTLLAGAPYCNVKASYGGLTNLYQPTVGVNTYYGTSVAIGGTTHVVGCGNGVAQAWEGSTQLPVHATYSVRSGSCAVSGDGNTVAFGEFAPTASGGGPGAVWTYVKSAGVLTFQSYIQASDPANGRLFGNCVSLSQDGKILAVGSNGYSAYVFRRP